jgi:hypothetical protein
VVRSVLAVALLLLALVPAQIQAQPPAEIEGYRLLYVPAENLDTVLQRDAKGVFLPQDEFRKLVQQARANADKLGERPAYVVVSNVNYVAKIDGEQLVIQATAKLDNTVPGWADLAIPVEGLSIEQIQLNNGPAAAARDGGNPNVLHLFFDKPGQHTLTITFSAPLVAVGSDQTAGFTLLPASAAELKVSVPASSFLVVDGLQLKRPAANDQPAEYTVAVGGKPRVQLQFTGRQATERADVLTLANTAFGVRVTPGDVAWSARTQLQVFGRAVNRLVCKVPRTLEITSVESTGLESWELADTEGDASTTTITLNYRQPIDGGRPISFHGVVRVEPGQAWDVPRLEIDGVASHVGVVRVDFPPGVRVRPDKSTGVRQVTNADIPAELAPATPGDQSLLFQVWKPDFKLTFTTETKAREVQVGVTTLVDVNDQGLDLNTTATLETRFAPLFDVLVSLPAGWQILSTQVNSQPVDHQVLPNEAGTQLLRIALNPPLPPGESRTVQVSAHIAPENWPLEEAKQRLPLPEVKFPQAGVLEGLYGITSSAGLEVVPVELQGLDTARTPDMNLLKQKLGPLAGNLRQGFTYQDGQVAGQLDAVRQPPRTAVSSRSFFRIEPDGLFTHVEADLTFSGGGLRKLSLTLPEQTGTDLRFRVIGQPVPNAQAAAEVVQIIEQTSAAPVNGLRTWTLRFDRFLVGNYVLAVDLRTPKAGEAFTAPQLRILGAERENGYIAVEAREDQLIAPQAADAALRPLQAIDPVDLPASLFHSKDRIVAAYFADRGGWQVVVKEQKFARTAIPTAIVHSAVLSTVIGETGEWQNQAEIVYSAVGIQGFNVQVENAELWAANIDEVPVEVRRQGDQFLISAGSSSGESRHTLRLLYRTSGPPTFDADSGRLQQRPPTIHVIDGAGKPQPLEVLDQQWTVHYPQQWILTASGGSFRPAHRFHPSGLISSTWHSLTAPRPESWGRTIGLAVLIFGSAFFLRWVLGRAVNDKADHRRLGYAIGGVAILAILFALLAPASRKAATSMRGGTDVASSRSPLPQANYLEDDVQYFPPAAEMPAPASGPVPTPAVMTAPATPAPGFSEPSFGRPDLDATKDAGQPFAPQKPEPVPPPAPSPSDGQSQLLLAEDEMRQEEKSGEGAPRKRPRPSAAAAPMAGNAGSKPGDDKAEMYDKLDIANSTGDRAGGESKQNRNGSAMSGKSQNAKGMGLDVSELSTESLTINGPSANPAVQSRFTADPQSGESKPSGYSRDAGLLSLNTTLLVPDGTDSETFHHHGEDGVSLPSQAPALDITYRRAGMTNTRTWAVAAGLLLLTWFARKSHRLIWPTLALTLLVPFAVAPLLPASIQDLLDGLFLGSLAGFGLLCVIHLAHWICCAVSNWRPWRKATTTAALLLSLVTIATSAQAQDAPPDVNDHEALVVPYGGEDPLTSFRVFVPQATFLKLYSQANPGEAPPVEAGVPAVLAESLYSVALQPDAATPTALVQARFLIESFRDAQTKLLLPLHAVAFKSAKLGDKSAPILIENNRPVLLLSARGKSVLDVEFELPVETTGPAGRFTLQLDPASAARLSFELPNPELEVRLNGATGLYRRRTAEAKTFIEAPVDRGGVITLGWQPKQMKGIDSAIVQVETTVGAVFDDRGLLASNGFLIRSRQGTISELRFALPKEFSLKQISGPDVGGWQQDDANAGANLRVFFRRPIDGETRLQIDLFRPLVLEDAAEIVLPELVPQEVSREVGQIAVFAADQFGLRIGEVSGAAQIDVGKFAPTSDIVRPADAPRVAYRFTSRPVKIAVTPSRRQPETVVSAEHGIYIGLRKQIVASLFHYELSGAPRASVSFALPAGYLPIDVEAGDALSDWYTSPAGDGSTQTLTVEFTGPRTGAQEVVLQGRVTRQPDLATAAIQVPRPLELTRATTTLGVWFDDIYSASLRDVPEAWKSAPVDQATTHLQQLQPRPLQFLFRSSGLELPAVTFDVTRNIPQLSGDTITLVAVSDTSVDYGLTLRWKITRAAADAFQFVTSPWLEGRLQFQDPQIRQVVSSKIDGGIRWTITLNEPVREEYLLSAIATLPPAADEVVQFPTIQLEQPTTAAAITELETQRHFGVLVNLSSRQLAPLNAASVNSVTRQNLPFVIQDSLLEQAMEVVELPRSGKSPQWKSQRAEEVQGTLASVTGADLVTVFDHDGSWRTRADYTVRSRGQQFLGVRLPPASRILAAVVKGRPSRTVVTTLGPGEIHLVPLPETNISDLSLHITLILAGNVGGPFSDSLAARAQSFDIPAPQVIPRTESAEFGMTVAQTLWTVYAPDDFQISPISDSARNNMMPEDEDDFGVTAQIQSAQRQLADAVDLLRISNSEKYSASQRMNSANNLKQLNLSISQYEQDAGRVSGENRRRYDDFLSDNRALFEQAQQAIQQQDQPTVVFQQGINAQEFIAGNTLQLNEFNKGRQVESATTEGVIQDGEGEQQFRFKSLSKEAAGKKSGPGETSRGRLRNQIANQGQADFYQQPVAGTPIGQPGPANQPQRPGGRGYRIEQQQLGQSGGSMGGGMGGLGGGGFGGYGGPAATGTMPARDYSGMDGEADGLASTRAPFRQGSFTAAEAAPWSSAGGLSLQFDVPRVGQKLHFSKVGGSPKLAIAARPRETWERLTALAWTLLWLVVAVLVVRLIRDKQAASRALTLAPIALAILGAGCYLLLPGDGRLIGVIIWLVLAAWIASTGLRRAGVKH